jgi:UDP-N-acetylglucosamine--N-acetylmuramyl-(pentapeptide) pyrophosphoryl-undecaprenol N-acetylglucosamine transferase
MTEPTPSAAGRPLRVLIAGGGTGGHLFPGIALAERIRGAGGEVLFVGTERGIETRVLPEEGWKLDLVDVAGIKGRGLVGLVGGLARLPRAYVQSRRIIKRFMPDVVVGVGGYASGPVVATAAMSGLPTALLEQNSIPGITNRILGRIVRRIYCTFEDRTGRFPADKVVLSGNPIRADLLERLRATGAAKREGARPRLFVFGGSQGARALNDGMIAALPRLLERLPALEIWHQTGQADEERVQRAYTAADLEPPRARVSAFIRDMAEPYGWCDLVLSRAGATSLSELAAVGRPAVLVPFPFAADNHQEHNAKSFVERGAALLLLQEDMTTETLVDTVAGVLEDGDRLARMTAAMQNAGRSDAAHTVLAGLVELADGAL